MTLDEVTAHLEIQQALARYCRGLDRGDHHLICSAYHRGALDRDRLTNPDGPIEIFAREAVAKLDKPRQVPQHHITNVLIDLDGDRAHVESYFLLLRPQTHATTGDDELTRAGGRYLDRFERRDGHWRIAERRVVLDWSERPMGSAQYDRGERQPVPGRRDKDPSWAFFGPHFPWSGAR